MDTHLNEKCGNVGGDKYAGDVLWTDEEVMTHAKMTCQASEEDIDCCDERGGLVPRYYQEANRAI